MIGQCLEYKQTAFLDILKQDGTLPHSPCPGTSPKNGTAEHKHRRILDTVCALLIFASIPEQFWGEAALTTVYTINRMPSLIISNQSPYERFFGIPPRYSNLKTFGYACFVLLR